MPRSGVPYRVYFFSETEIQWVDVDAAGKHVWSRTISTFGAWPGLEGFGLDKNGQFTRPVQSAVPVSPTILRVTGVSAVSSSCIDVAKGSAVPDPLTGAAWSGEAANATSWDVGPIVLYRNDDHSNPKAVDLRNGSAVETQPFPYVIPVNFTVTGPMFAVPGLPVMWPSGDEFVLHPADDNSNTLVFTRANNFFDGLAITELHAATVVYGSFLQPVLADVTAALSDQDIWQIGSQIAGNLWWTDSLRRHEWLAVFYLLSGLRPTAYHPDGFYGLVQLSATQLFAGGWTDPAENFLQAEVADQLRVLLRWTGAFPEPAQLTGDPARLLALILVGQPAGAGDDDTVVAHAPFPSRLNPFVDVSPDGLPADVVTLGDLRQALLETMTGPLYWELAQRSGGCSLA